MNAPKQKVEVLGILTLALIGLGLAVAAMLSTSVYTTDSTDCVDCRMVSTDPRSVDRVVSRLVWANSTFDVPRSMAYDQQYSAELVLSPSLSFSELADRLKQRLGTESARVRVSNRMEAKLAGDGFKVESATPALQAVRHQGFTRWKWRVNPTKDGVLWLERVRISV